VPADGHTAANATVTLKDPARHPVPDKRVVLAKAAGPGAPTITAPPNRTDANVHVTFTVSSSSVGYGISGDIAVPGDYDGDGSTDIAVFRPSSGVWYVHPSSGGATSVGYGTSGDVALAAAPA